MEQVNTDPAQGDIPVVAYSAVGAGLACAAIILVVEIFQSNFYRVFVEPRYVVLDVALEFFSIVVAYSVFAVGWYGYKQNRNTQDLYIAMIFMVTGAIDFAHTMSYQGMPPFLTPNTSPKSSMLWIAGRMFLALSLLVAAFVRPDSKKPWMTPRVLMPAAVATIAAVVVPISYWHQALPSMFVTGVGQTPLHVGMEYTTVVVLLLAILAFGRYARRERSSVDLLQVALVVAIFAEIATVLYLGASDAFNLLGHLFKVVAFYFMFRALFVSSLQRPYGQLVAAREELSGLVEEMSGLYEQADEQRARLERSFAQISSALGSSLEFDKVLELIGELAADMTGAEAVAVAVPDEELPVLNIRASRALMPGERRIPLKDSIAADVISQMAVKRVDDASARKTWVPRIEPGDVLSILAAPIIFEDQVLGVLTLYSTRRNAFTESNEVLLAAFARQAGVAVDNVSRYARERRIAQTFQRRLLPTVPKVDGLELAARYEPASPTAEVGGDLYDAILLDPERLALAIGDVSGKGLDAATVMASTLYMMRGFLFQGMQPGDVLSSLQAALSTELDPAQFVTVFLSILDLETFELSYANAGHPFPIVMTAEGCDSIVGHNGGPVGAPAIAGMVRERLGGSSHWAVADSPAYKTDRMALPKDFGMLMYTDGMLDARANGDLFGVDRILEICRASRDATSDELVQNLLSAAREFSESSLPDDIALLAARSVREPVLPFSWDI